MIQLGQYNTSQQTNTITNKSMIEKEKCYPVRIPLALIGPIVLEATKIAAVIFKKMIGKLILQICIVDVCLFFDFFFFLNRHYRFRKFKTCLMFCLSVRFNWN